MMNKLIKICCNNNNLLWNTDTFSQAVMCILAFLIIPKFPRFARDGYFLYRTGPWRMHISWHGAGILSFISRFWPTYSRGFQACTCNSNSSAVLDFLFWGATGGLDDYPPATPENLAEGGGGGGGADILLSRKFSLKLNISPKCLILIGIKRSYVWF